MINAEIIINRLVFLILQSNTLLLPTKHVPGASIFKVGIVIISLCSGKRLL